MTALPQRESRTVAAPRVRRVGGKSGVHRPARRTAAERRALLRRLRGRGQHIGLVPGGGQGMTSPVAYWHVPDIEAKLAEVTAAGATVKESRAMWVVAAWWLPSPTRRQCPRAAAGPMSADFRSGRSASRDTGPRLTHRRAGDSGTGAGTAPMTENETS